MIFENMHAATETQPRGHWTPPAGPTDSPPDSPHFIGESAVSRFRLLPNARFRQTDYRVRSLLWLPDGVGFALNQCFSGPRLQRAGSLHG